MASETTTLNGETPTPALMFMETPITHVFIDCDDCLYQNEWRTAKKITASIAKYTQMKLNVSKDKAYALYKQYGTCLKGLLEEGIIDQDGVEDFLREVHLIDYSDIAPDPELEIVLAALHAKAPCWVFTASAREHAQRCLTAIGLDALPWRGIIDTRDCGLESKHDASSFEAAMRVANANDPNSCLFLDDSVKNVKSAKKAGWKTVLVGLRDRDSGALIECAEADAHVASLRDVAALLSLNGHATNTVYSNLADTHAASSDHPTPLRKTIPTPSG